VSGARASAQGWGWQHAGRSTPAVSGLDLDVHPGERVLLLGPSGAGKSTLMAALAGVLGGADEGEETGRLAVDGTYPADLRGVAGLVLQDPDANTIMARVGDDVAFGCENLGVGREEIWTRVHEALERVGLAIDLQRSTAQLSGGERQRLALAGVIAMRPGLLLLDEPTANLDPEGVRRVHDAVAAVLQTTGATLVVVEHRVDVWLDLVDRVVVLEPGAGVMADGSAAEVLRREGPALAARGVWVPGLPLELERARAEPGSVLLSAEALVFGRDEPLHRGFDWHQHAGVSTVLTGPNGAGKSTLATTLAGLRAPLDGRVVSSAELAAGAGPYPYRWRSRQLLTRIGTVFQQPAHQFVAASVRRELEVGPRAAGASAHQARAQADTLLERLRLTSLASANPHTLSGGEQRRLSVATVLATGPRLIVLDEPTFGQDRLTWVDMVGLMAGLVAEGVSLLSATHDPEVVRLLGDRRIELPAADVER